MAHRGASGYAPENTMAAFRRAVELGATFIETDLQLTRDAQIVAMHDSTLDRTTNGKGPIHMKARKEIRTLDAGSWFPSQDGSFAGERVPTLEEILEFAKSRDIVFYLEIKGGTWGIEHAIVAALRDSAEAARVVVISFDPATVEFVQRLDRSLMAGFLCEFPSTDLVERAVRIGARQLIPRGDIVTSALVDKAHHAGLQVVTWTINEPEQMRHLIETGVDGIMTDYPDRLIQVVKESGA